MATERNRYLLKIFSGPHTGAEILLGDGSYIIGADDECDIIFCDQTVAARHLRLNVSDGHMHVAALDKPVFIDGKAAGEGEHLLERFQTVTIGTTHFGLGPADEKWPLPVLPEIPAAMDATAEEPEKLELVKRRGQEMKAAEPERANAPLKFNRKILIGAGGATALLIVFLILFLGTEPSIKPDKTADKIASVAGIRQILQDMNLKQLKIDSRMGNQIAVSGYVDSLEETRKLRTALIGFYPPVNITVWAREQQLTTCREILEAMGTVLDVKIEKPGIIMLSGIAENGAKFENALTLLRQDVPGIKRFETRVVTKDILNPALSEVLQRHGLKQKVEFQAFSTHILAKGVLTEAEVPKWLQVKSQIENRYGEYFNIKEKLTVTKMPPRKKMTYTAGKIDLSISGISTGKVRYITTADGKKYFEGGRLKNGYTIKSIQRNRIILIKNGREFEYNTGGE